MGKVLFGVIAAVASFMLVESLTCNTCSFSLLGFCVNSGQVTCSTNTSTCFTGTTTFPSLSSFTGLTMLGCREASNGCNMTTNGTVLLATFQTTIKCCSTNNCNTVNGAPSTKVTLTTMIGAAILASMWGSTLY